MPRQRGRMLRRTAVLASFGHFAQARIQDNACRKFMLRNYPNKDYAGAACMRRGGRSQRQLSAYFRVLVWGFFCWLRSATLLRWYAHGAGRGDCFLGMRAAMLRRYAAVPLFTACLYWRLLLHGDSL
jgi:hypothetical protein